jgi:hypothetical protein
MFLNREYMVSGMYLDHDSGEELVGEWLAIWNIRFL